MDILKLFFDHDQRLDRLAKRNANKTAEEAEATLSDFMEPTKTYSKFYLTGTKLDEEKFGLNVISEYPNILQRLNEVFKNRTCYTDTGEFGTFTRAVSAIDIGQVIVISETSEDINISELEIDEESNVGHRKEELSNALNTGAYVIYKEQAHHGFDLHLFSQANIYIDLLYALRPLAKDDLRFFSINSKRMGSERHFYFETWTLKKPPHGAEEVFPETTV